MHLRQSTASQSVVIGPFVDSADGNTAETGLTIANTDIRLSKNGANIVGKNSGGGTHDEIGYYTITLDATDTNTVGRLQLMVHASGALPVYHEYEVLEENVYDALYAASATLGTDVAAILVDTSTTLQGELDGIQADTEDIQSRLPAALVGGRIDANVGAISGDATAADNLETAFDDTAGPVPMLGIIDQGTAQSATATTLVLRAATPFGSDDACNGATLWAFGSDQGYWQARVITDYVTATDTATVATWDVTPSGTITYKIFGTAPQTSSGGGATAQEVWEYATRELTALDEDNTTIDLNAAIAAAAPTAAAIADAVWDEAQADHVSAGTFGEVATEIASILVDTAEIGAAGAGLTEAGGTGDHLTAIATAAALTTVDTVVDGIKAVTDALPDAGALTSLATAVAVADLPTNAELSTALAAADDAVLAAIAALNNLSAAQVNAEVVDALATDTIAELTGDPGATPTIRQALMLPYMALRNRRDTTADSDEIHNNAGTPILEATVSDDGTVFTKGKYAAP